MRSRSLVLSVVALALAASGTARPQGPLYTAQPPTLGALYRDGQTNRYLLGGAWLYRADVADVGMAQGWWRAVAATDGWSPVAVPNAYNAGDLSSASMNGYVGWYRRDFVLPQAAFPPDVAFAARHWIARFEAINYRATVWLNGQQIGSHVGAYLPFEIDLSGLRDGVNQLVVRVDDRRTVTDLPPGPSGGWWNYGGITREVYLRPVQRVDLAQVQVRPLLPCRTCAATIDERALVRNVTAEPQTVHVRGSYGKTSVDFGVNTIAPRATWTAEALIRIAHPRLWSPDQPALYRASLTVSGSSGRRLGGYVTFSGIRSITVTHDGRLELNWRRLNLRGTSFHEQDLALGSALDQAHMARVMGWVRALGAGVIRSHYPLNPEIQELADRYGVLIWSEIPVYQLQSQYLAQVAVAARTHAMLRDDILANQNHPSVLLWSIGNELQTPADAVEASYVSGAATLAHRLDPTRPVGMAVSAWPGVGCQSAYSALDVIGFNDYFGWFSAGGGATADRDGLGPFLDSFRSCYPTKALLVTEFGFEGNRDGPVEERGTYQFQADSTAYHLGVFATKPWLSGAIYFALQDFAARPGWGGGNPWPNPPFVQKGAFDLQGNAKPLFALMASLYRSTVQIAPARGVRSSSAKRARR